MHELDEGKTSDPLLRLRIDELMSDYVQCIDADQLEHWPSFFTEDGRYRITTRENYEMRLPISLAYCAGKGMLKDRISALRNANIFEPQVYCHMISALKVIDRASGSYSTQANFMITRITAHREMCLFASGRYLDRIVEDGEVLRFKERTVVLDSRGIDTLLAIPI